MRTALAVALLSCAAPAQITVRTGQNLQTAVDAIPDGGYLLIEAGTYQPIQIVNKSVVLFGLGAWWITTPADPIFNRPSLFSPGHQIQPSPIEVVGGSSNWVYIANARLGWGGEIGAAYGVPADGIRAAGLGLVYVIDTYAAGAICSQIENCGGGLGIQLERVDTVVLERSLVMGRASVSLLNNSPIDGAPAVRAPGSHAVLVGVWLEGGEGAAAYIWSSTSFEPCPCPWLASGYGGNALEAGSVYNLGAIFQPGLGGRVHWYEILNQPPYAVFHPRGRQPAGLPFVQR